MNQKIRNCFLIACCGWFAACGNDATDRSVASSSTEPTPTPVSAPALADPADGITSEDLMGHIGTLASDEFGGRAPMTEGERLTLDYLEQQFREAGLQPMFGDSYRQAVPLVSIEASAETALTVKDDAGGQQIYAYGPEAMYWTSRVVENAQLEDSELVWVGYGVVAPEYEWNDYEGIDMAGKTAVILVNDPGFATGDPELFNGRKMTYYGRWRYKYEEAVRQGAAGALIIHQTEPAAYGWKVVEDSWSGPQFHLASEDGNLQNLVLEGWLQHQVATDIFQAAGLDLEAMTQAAAKGPVKPLPLGHSVSAPLVNTLKFAESYNVGAIRPGDRQADELFIYMAHWDHLGTTAHEPGAEGDFIFNGAEDNASGTSGLLELAAAFGELPANPARTVGFLAVTAEESGLLGSQAYAADPAWPMNRTVAGINMDRLNFRGQMSDVVVIGHGASEMEDILAEEAAPFGRTVTPEATPEKGFYYRSDHFNFAKRGVPILYARGGTVDRNHGADYVAARNAEYVANRYHAPADEIQDDWDMDAAIEDLLLFYNIGLRLANSEDWPQWREGNEFRAIREASMEEGAD
jgi:Zn-dependent M28 family amino/carboxypeptidase